MGNSARIVSFTNTETEKYSFSESKIKVFNKELLNDIKSSASESEMRQLLDSISPHFNNKTGCTNHWIVVADFSKSIIDTAKRFSNWCIVIVTENKQNTDQIETNIFYLTREIQDKLAEKSTFFKTIGQLSQHNYAARKNAGYLWAILHGATTIWDFHSDNELLIEESTDLLPLNDTVNALTVPNHQGKLFNPLPFYLTTTSHLWPRGFPVQFINNTYKNISEIKTLYGEWPIKNIGVIQSLTQYHPDIDSFNGPITEDSPIIHLKKLANYPTKNIKLIIPRRTFSPYNEQATLHFRPALWALLLPITIKHHLSDIWRSYAMQRLMWDVGLQVAFAGPHVIKKQYVQYKSSKDLYHKNDKFFEFLTNWSSNHTSLMKRAEQLYIDLYERDYIEIDDVHLIRLWFHELSQYNYIFPNIAPKFTLAVRTFSGHLSRMNHRYFPTLNMFVDRNVFDIMVILDDESQKDHELGKCLQKHNFSIKYEALPEFTNKEVQLKGYDRQQWSTFFMDRYSDSDYIGVIDADGIIFSFMHPLYSIFASDDDKRIMLKPMVGDHYFHNRRALGFYLDLDFMWPNRMPMWYRWETYQNLRNYIVSAWNGLNFNDAFVEFSKNEYYSQFTILSSYATRFEPDYYRVIVSSDGRGAVSVGSNGGREIDIRIGCCRSFNIGCNDTSMPENNYDHLFRYDSNPFVVVNATEKTNAYYEHVHAYLKQMPMESVLHMKQSCQAYLNNTFNSICV